MNVIMDHCKALGIRYEQLDGSLLVPFDFGWTLSITSNYDLSMLDDRGSYVYFYDDILYNQTEEKAIRYINKFKG